LRPSLHSGHLTQTLGDPDEIAKAAVAIAAQGKAK